MKEPKIANNEIGKLDSQFKAYEKNLEALTMDRMNMAAPLEHEPQTKLSSREIAKAEDIYLKPIRTIGGPDKFNECFRDQWNHAKEYVKFIAENYEVIGESIYTWTKPFAGIPCEYWNVPTNKPVHGPRYLAEQISRCKYHRLKTEDKITMPDNNGIAQYGALVVDHVIHRLDAKPVREQTRVFLGASSF